MATAQKLKWMLQQAQIEDNWRCFKAPNGGYMFSFANGVPTSSTHPNMNPGAIVIDRSNGTVYYNSNTLASPTYTDLVAASVGTLQQVTTAGKTSNVGAISFTGANEAANGVQIGDGTDYVRIYEASSQCIIDTVSAANLTLSPAGDLILAPTGTDITMTGNATVSGTLAVAGAATFGTFSTDAIAAGTTDATLTVDGNGSGGVNICSISTGGITLSDDTALAASKTLTLAGVAATNVFTITAGDAVMSDGSLSITDADNATTLSIINDTLSTANMLFMRADALASGGAMIHLDSDGIPSGAFYLELYNGSANDLTIGQYGAIAITGNASTDVLTLTAGDLQITAGDIDLDRGFIAVDNNQDEGNTIARNFAGAGTAPVLTITDDHASSTNFTVKIDSDGTAGKALYIDHEGSADCVTIETAVAAASGIKLTTSAATGTGIELICAASTTTSMLVLDGSTGDWIGADGVGLVNIACDGALAHANASCLNITYSGGGAASGLGTSLRIVDTGSEATAYAVYINAATGEALNVAAGTSIFAEQVTLTGGALFAASGATFTPAANVLDIDGGAANDDIIIGSNTDTDLLWHGTSGAALTCTAATDTLTVSATAQVVVTGNGTGTGLAIPYHATNSPSDTVAGSIFFEVDASKLWVYTGVGWVGTVLA